MPVTLEWQQRQTVNVIGVDLEAMLTWSTWSHQRVDRPQATAQLSYCLRGMYSSHRVGFSPNTGGCDGNGREGLGR